MRAGAPGPDPTRCFTRVRLAFKTPSLGTSLWQRRGGAPGAGCAWGCARVRRGLRPCLAHTSGLRVGWARHEVFTLVHLGSLGVHQPMVRSQSGVCSPETGRAACALAYCLGILRSRRRLRQITRIDPCVWGSSSACWVLKKISVFFFTVFWYSWYGIGGQGSQSEAHCMCVVHSPVCSKCFGSAAPEAAQCCWSLKAARTTPPTT